jgi:hypothetical protein
VPPNRGKPEFVELVHSASRGMSGGAGSRGT